MTRRISKQDRDTLRTWLQNTHSQKERTILAKFGYNDTDVMIDALVSYSNEKKFSPVMSW